MSAVSGNGVINIASDGITVVTESCRFSNDGSDDVSEAVERKDDEHASMRDYKRAKAQIASTIKKMKDRNQSDN